MKLRTLIAIIIVILIVAGVVFYFISRPRIASPAAPGSTGSLPSVTTEPFSSSTSNNNAINSGSSTVVSTTTSSLFGIVSNDPALNYFVDSRNTAEIVEPNGAIETIASGTTTVLSSTTFQDIITASFSYDGKKVLVNSGNPANPETQVFDLATQSWITLPSGMQSPVWSPNSYQIAYLNSDNSGNETIFLETLTASSTRSSLLKPLTMENSALQWPDNNTIIVSDRPSAFALGSALSLDISTKTVTPVAIEDPGIETIWSNTKPMTGLLFFGGQGYQGGSLSLVTATGSETVLKFTTLASKCTFNDDVSTTTHSIAPASTTKSRATSTTNVVLVTTTTTLDLYCAIPRDQDTISVAHLPDEYDQKMFFTADDFYKVTASTGAFVSVFSDPTQTLDATDLKVFNGILFFVNRYDQKLYAIQLSASS